MTLGRTCCATFRCLLVAIVALAGIHCSGGGVVRSELADANSAAIAADYGVADGVVDDPADDAVRLSCAMDEQLFDGHCYSVLGVKGIPFGTARQICASRQAQIVAIDHAGEDSFVYAILPLTCQTAWIGLTRQDDGFVWESGAPLGYANWAPGEPNNEGGAENCAVLWGPNLSHEALRSRWNDEACDSGQQAVICERPATE
jgi:hypothetical protein